MSAMIDQMDRANNHEGDNRQVPANEDISDSSTADVSGSYYYDDSTGYEAYEDDDEESSPDIDANKLEGED